MRVSRETERRSGLQNNVQAWRLGTWRYGVSPASAGARVRAQPQDKAAVAGRETERTEAAAQLERKMAAMEAVLATRRQPAGEAPKPEAARGPGADLRFQARSRV